VKQDGFRLIVSRDGARVRLFTRNGYDWTSRYPLIVESTSHPSSKARIERGADHNHGNQAARSRVLLRRRYAMKPSPRKPKIISAQMEGRQGTADSEIVSVSTDMFPEAPKAEKSDEPPSLDVT
jgi:hypothetical protein